MSRTCSAIVVLALGMDFTRASELDEVVVTSRKTAEKAAEVPTSIAVASGSLLQATQTRDLIQLAEQIPGMVFSRAPDDGLALTVRGVGTPARSQAFEQSIALFVDGVFLPKGRLYPQAFFDLERIELFRGPQTTLLGKNASAGALTLVTRQPGNERSSELRAGYELQEGGYVLNAATDLPFNEQTALRAAVQRVDTHGWVRNLATGRDVPADDETAARLTLNTTFAAATEATFRVQHVRSERIGLAMQLLDAELDDRSRALTPFGRGGDSVHDVRSTLAGATLRWTGQQLRVISESAYVAFDASYIDDLDFNESSNVNFLRVENFWQASQEFRLESVDEAPLDYSLGLAVFRSDWDSLEDQRWTAPGFPPGTPLAGELFNGPFVNDFAQQTRTVSLFATGRWQWAPRWQASLGIRYTDEDKRVLYGRTAQSPFTLWNTAINPPFPITPLEFADRFADGHVALQRQLGPRAMAYASVSRGTKSGGFVETNGVPSADPSIDARIESEVTQAQEIGIKSAWLEGRFRFDIAAFNMDIDDFQDTTFNGVAFVTLNLPARSRGVEMQSQWRPRDAWELAVGATYARASARIDGQWFPMTQAPLWTANASVEHSRSVSAAWRLRVRADARHRGRMFNQRGGLFPSDRFTPLGLMIAMERQDGAWGVDVVARNLRNAVTADFMGPTPDPYAPASAAPARFRTVTFSVWAKF